MSWYLLALVADIVCVSVHGKACRVIVEACSWSSYCLTLMQALILQTHQSLSPHILIELFDRIKQILDDRVIDFVLEGNTNQPSFRNSTKQSLQETFNSCWVNLLNQKMSGNDLPCKWDTT